MKTNNKKLAPNSLVKETMPGLFMALRAYGSEDCPEHIKFSCPRRWGFEVYDVTFEIHMNVVHDWAKCALWNFVTDPFRGNQDFAEHPDKTLIRYVRTVSDDTRTYNMRIGISSESLAPDNTNVDYIDVTVTYKHRMHIHKGSYRKHLRLKKSGDIQYDLVDEDLLEQENNR